MCAKRFIEPENTAVFTTKFVTSDHKEITLIKHNKDDNTWEFFSNDTYYDYEKIARIVSLKEIIDIDTGVLDVADIKPGFYAHRKSKKDSWIIEKLEDH